MEVDKNTNEGDQYRNPVVLLANNAFGQNARSKSTYKTPMVISDATFMLAGFSQVLDVLLSLQSDESEVLDEDRPITRLGSWLQVLVHLSFSDSISRLLRIGIRGPME